MKRIVVGLLISVILFLGWVIWLAWFSSRPPLTMDPAVLAGDGSTINYCDLPVLDNSGPLATDIPKGNTPGCGYKDFPMPILANCTEVLPEGVADIRGLWQAVEGKVDHVERVEQCGARTVVSSAGIIHDLGPNSTAGETSNDTEGSVQFLIGDKEYCMRTSAGIFWENNQLNFRAFGFGPVVVKRYMDGDQLVWEYADGSVTRMNRICQLPEVHKKPKPRGARKQFFPG